MLSWRDRQKTAGKCVSCASGKARPNRVHCAKCATKPRPYEAENHKRYRKNHPERLALMKHRTYLRYVAKHPDFIPTKIRHMKIWKAAHPEQWMLNKARDRAKRNGKPFSITVADIHVPKRCPILGIPLFWGNEQKSENSPSLDCLIPHLGYVPGNVFVMSMRANRLKGDGSWQELKKISDWVRKEVLRAAR